MLPVIKVLIGKQAKGWEDAMEGLKKQEAVASGGRRKMGRRKSRQNKRGRHRTRRLR